MDQVKSLFVVPLVFEIFDFENTVYGNALGIVRL
jgi:hypothetical protein